MHVEEKDGVRVLVCTVGKTAAGNPVGGWYGLKRGLRERFGVYVPPPMEELGLCELEHNAKNNRMRTK